jgi:hypothetical protein
VNQVFVTDIYCDSSSLRPENYVFVRSCVVCVRETNSTVASASGQQFRCCPVLPTSRISYGLSVSSLACWLVGVASSTPFSNMAKTRVGVMLRETVGGKNKSNNRSVDLENLQKNQWPAFIKKIQTVIQALQQHHGNLKRLEQSRQMVGYYWMTDG